MPSEELREKVKKRMQNQNFKQNFTNPLNQRFKRSNINNIKNKQVRYLNSNYEKLEKPSNVKNRERVRYLESNDEKSEKFDRFAFNIILVIEIENLIGIFITVLQKNLPK